MAEQTAVQALWEQVNQAVRRGPINRSLWEAVEAAVPLTIDEDVMILGFEPKNMRHASYIETTVNKTRILEIVQARTGKRLDLRCIEGADKEAWERAKSREQESEQRARDAFESRQVHATSLQSWEDLGSRLQNLYSRAEARRLALVQAQMLVKSLPLIYEVDSEVRRRDPEGEYIHNRELNRVFDRVGTFCELSPTQVALEYLRYRGSRKAQK